MRVMDALRETEFQDRAFPNRVWEREKKPKPSSCDRGEGRSRTSLSDDGFCRPYRGLGFIAPRNPTAYAVGYNQPPLPRLVESAGDRSFG